MLRSVKLSLSSLTATKSATVGAVLRECRAAASFYCSSLWREPGKLDAETLKRYSTGRLRYDQRSSCLRMALATVAATRSAARTLGTSCSVPQVTGAIRLSCNCAKVEVFSGEGFDYAIKLTNLMGGKPVVLPLRSHRVLKKWLAMPGAYLKNGCTLHENYVVLCIEIPDLPEKEHGKDIGLDTGYRKMATTSDGFSPSFYGIGFRDLCKKVSNKKPGGRGKAQALAARDQYLNSELKKIPWQDVRKLAVEDLSGLRDRMQRKGKNTKKQRKTMAPWTYRQVLNRVEQLAQEHRVRLVYVDPRNTSRRCPACGLVAKENRVKEDFRCVACNHSGDADYIGATNILARMTGNWQDDMVPASSNHQGLGA